MADLVAPSRSKRARSPSPAYGGDTLASPLEVLLKRRRRGEWTTSSGNAASTSRTSNGGSSMFVPPPPPPVWRPDPYSHHQHTSRNIEEGDDDAHASSSQAATSSPLRRRDDDDDMAESSTAWMRRAGVERRRQRAWEYLQNPATSSNVPNTASAPTTTAATHTQSHSQPETQMQMHMQMQIESSPAARYARARSASALHQPAQTPEPAATHPANMSSSPVRHRPPSSTPFRGDDEWTEDERMREWGAEYAAQNALLYSLHRARVDGGPLTSDPPTPASQVYNTHTTPQSNPYGLVPTPYRYAQRTPLATPGLVSSPYESSPVPFSPAIVPPPAGPVPSPATHDHEAVRVGYEETNRLLAALNVARLRRHGADSHEHDAADNGPGQQHAPMDEMDEHW